MITKIVSFNLFRVTRWRTNLARYISINDFKAQVTDVYVKINDVYIDIIDVYAKFVDVKTKKQCLLCKHHILVVL